MYVLQTGLHTLQYTLQLEKYQVLVYFATKSVAIITRIHAPHCKSHFARFLENYVLQTGLHTLQHTLQLEKIPDICFAIIIKLSITAI